MFKKKKKKKRHNKGIRYLEKFVDIGVDVSLYGTSKGFSMMRLILWNIKFMH